MDGASQAGAPKELTVYYNNFETVIKHRQQNKDMQFASKYNLSASSIENSP